ncbi:unnamed protein product [Ilex paraguariensis]|uniref:Uncharacterized protein n=1 Tax=Ilex paraguariensis TaxID=185542 RepID=A0ABC8R6Z9_9AQUA
MEKSGELNLMKTEMEKFEEAGELGQAREPGAVKKQEKEKIEAILSESDRSSNWQGIGSIVRWFNCWKITRGAGKSSLVLRFVKGPFSRISGLNRRSSSVLLADAGQEGIITGIVRHVAEVTRRKSPLPAEYFPAMSAAKPSQPPSSTSVCTLHSSFLTLAIVTLVSFTSLSLRSLHSPTLQSSSPRQTLLPINTSQVVRENNVEEELPDLYHSPEIFRLTYAEMVRRFKVFIYPDGDPNTFYQKPRKLTGKYASEGYFFQNIRESKFRTDDPDQADLFFIPISCHKMRGKVQCVRFFHRRL